MSVNYKAISNEQEKEVYSLAKKLQFDNVKHNVAYQGSNDKGEDPEGGQIDVVFRHEKTMFIVECKSEKDAKDKFTKFPSRLTDYSNYLKKHFKKYRDCNRLVGIYAIKNNRAETKDWLTRKAQHRNKNSKSSTNIYIWDNDFVKYYLNDARKIDKTIAKYNLLAFHQIRDEESISIPCMRG